MLRIIVPIVLSALAAAPSAQGGASSARRAPQDGTTARNTGQAIRSSQAAPAPQKRHSGVHSLKEAAPLDPALVAALRARLERAKASGKVCRERLAHQEQLLARLEAQLRAAGQVRPEGGVPSARRSRR